MQNETRDIRTIPVADLTEAEFDLEYHRLVNAIAIGPDDAPRQAELIARKAQQPKPQAA